MWNIATILVYFSVAMMNYPKTGNVNCKEAIAAHKSKMYTCHIVTQARILMLSSLCPLCTIEDPI